MTTPTELEAAVERELARVIASENACEGETASWADRARAHDQDRRTILHALTEAKAENVQLRQDCAWADAQRQDNLKWAQESDAALATSEARRGELEGLVREFDAFAKSGVGFQYPLGSLQKIRHLLNPQQEGSRDHG